MANELESQLIGGGIGETGAVGPERRATFHIYLNISMPKQVISVAVLRMTVTKARSAFLFRSCSVIAAPCRKCRKMRA